MFIHSFIYLISPRVVPSLVLIEDVFGIGRPEEDWLGNVWDIPFRGDSQMCREAMGILRAVLNVVCYGVEPMHVAGMIRVASDRECGQSSCRALRIRRAETMKQREAREANDCRAARVLTTASRA